jgi:uncharacterized membrane protein
MNPAHYHLVLNHLPIIVPMIGLLVMIGGHIFQGEAVKRTAYFIFIFGALCTIPAFATGEGAEETIENIPGISEQLIKTHEEMADTFAILSYLLGAISLLGLWANLQQKSFANLLSFVAMIFCGVVLFFAKQTGTTGGEIRHTEIRADGATSPAGTGEGAQEKDD